MSDIQPLDLTKRTVFILGAGASQPYGLPLGKDLKTQMISNVSQPHCQDDLTAHGFERTMVQKYAEALKYTAHPTIDIFLEKKKQFRELGSYLIAYTLLPLEKHNSLFPQRDWYSHLYNRFYFESEKPDTSKIVFVSLNYDRSLEHFLAKNIEYNCSDEYIDFANSKLGRLKIIHAHGSLGKYPEQPYELKGSLTGNLQLAAKGIRIVSDKLDDSKDFLDAKEAIHNTQNLVFLGFGFDPTTLNMLIKGIDISDKRILGTVFQLDSAKIDQVVQAFNTNIEIGKKGVNAQQFIQEILP